MAKLYRPHIPLKVKAKVLRRQLHERELKRASTGSTIRLPRPSDSAPLKHQVVFMMSILAEDLSCEVEDLRLDHDPPLGARPKTGEGKQTVYDPSANDPNHLFYRPQATTHEGSHDVKTRIRGDHGQYSDVALIKRQRRRERAERPPTPHQIRRAFLKEQQRELRKRLKKERKKVGNAKRTRWQSRPFGSKKSPHRFGAR